MVKSLRLNNFISAKLWGCFCKTHMCLGGPGLTLYHQKQNSLFWSSDGAAIVRHNLIKVSSLSEKEKIPDLSPSNTTSVLHRTVLWFTMGLRETECSVGCLSFFFGCIIQQHRDELITYSECLKAPISALLSYRKGIFSCLTCFVRPAAPVRVVHLHKHKHAP